MRTVIHTVCRRCHGEAWQAVEGDSVEDLVQVAYEAATANILNGLLCRCSSGWGIGDRPNPKVEWVEEHFD